MTWSRRGRAGAGGTAAGVRGRARGNANAPHGPDARIRLHRTAVAGSTLMLAGGLLSGCSLLSPSPAPTVTVTPPAAPPVTPEPSTTARSSTSATPTTASSAPTTTSSTGPTDVATLAGGNGAAAKFVVQTAALGAGWTAAEPRDTGGYRMTVCGVDLEPASPVDAAQRRWSRAAAGPFLEQHVRVYSGTTASQVVTKLQSALKSCRSYAQGGQPFTVTPLKVTGADAATASWRQTASLALPAPTSTTTASPSASASSATLAQDVAVVRRGEAVVLLSSYAVDAQPQADVLSTALRAARAAG